MNAPKPPRPRVTVRRMIIAFCLGAVTSGTLGFFIGGALKRSGIRIPLPNWSAGDVASVVIAVLLLVCAGFALFATTSTARWNRVVERQPEDEPVDPNALKSGRSQAIVTALAGILMITPPIAMHAGPNQAGIAAVAAVMLALLTGQSWINWKIWRDGDELTRVVITQTGAVCFWVLQIALFGWAALTRLKLATDIDSWSLMTVMMGVYLLISVIISTRRGLVATA